MPRYEIAVRGCQDRALLTVRSRRDSRRVDDCRDRRLDRHQVFGRRGCGSATPPLHRFVGQASRHLSDDESGVPWESVEARPLTGAGVYARFSGREGGRRGFVDCGWCSARPIEELPVARVMRVGLAWTSSPSEGKIALCELQVQASPLDQDRRRPSRRPHRRSSPGSRAREMTPCLVFATLMPTGPSPAIDVADDATAPGGTGRALADADKSAGLEIV